MFTSSVISLISTTLVIYLFCKHKHIRMLVASLIPHKIKEVEANSNSEETNSRCRTPNICWNNTDSNEYGNRCFSCTIGNQDSAKDTDFQMP